MANMDTRLNIRCSSLGRFFKCAHFVKYPNTSIPSSDAAQNGTDLHRQAEHAFSDDLTPPDVVLNYVEYIRSLKERSTHYGLEDSFKSSLGEGYTLSGSIDFWAMDVLGNIEIVDLKTGTMPIAPYSPQLLGYGILLKDKYPDALSIRATVHQFGIANSIDITNLIETTRQDIITKLKTIKDAYLGTWCIWCNAFLECNLINSLVDNFINNITESEDGSVVNYDNLKHYKIIESYFKTLKNKFVESYPNKVEYSTRMIKTWVDVDDKNIPTQPMTVAKAIKNGYTNINNIKTIPTKTIKGFKYDEI